MLEPIVGWFLARGHAKVRRRVRPPPPPIGWSSELSDWVPLVRADNLFVMSRMAEDLRKICQAYEQALRGLKLHISAKSREVLGLSSSVWTSADLPRRWWPPRS